MADVPLPEGEVVPRGGVSPERLDQMGDWRTFWPVVFSVTWVVLLSTVAFLGLAASAWNWHWRSVLIAGLVAGVVVLARSAVVHRLPVGEEDRSWTRLWPSIGAIFGGLVALGVWRWWIPKDGIWFVGGSFVLLGLSQLVSEVRLRERSKEKARVLGAVTFALLVVVLVLSLLGIPLGWLMGVPGIVLLGLSVAIVLSLEAEDALSGGRDPRWRRMAVGAGLVLLGILLAARFLPGALYVVAVGLFLLGVVGTIVTNTDLDAVAGVVALAFMLALVPEPVGGVATPEDGDHVLVAFGDSYMSGEGAQTFLPDTNDPDGNHCRRASTAYAALAVSSGVAGMPNRLVFLACSGAKSHEIYADPQNPHEPLDVEGGLDQADNLRRQLAEHDLVVDLVIVSTGGNDAGFGEVGQTCLRPGDCSEVAQKWFDRLDVVDREVGRAYDAVDEVLDEVGGPRPPVVAVPYPMALAEERCDDVPFTDREWSTLRRFIDELDAVVERQAERAGFFYLEEMETVLTDTQRALCQDRRPGINFVGLGSVNADFAQQVNPSNWVHNSLHPNEIGHREMARVLTTWFAEHGGDAPPAPTDPGGYEGVRVDGATDGDLRACLESDEAATTPDDQPSPCNDELSSWLGAELATAGLTKAAPVVLAIVGGAWLVWVETSRLWRSRAWKLLKRGT